MLTKSSHVYGAAELLHLRLDDISSATGTSIWHVAIASHAIVYTTLINNELWLQVLDTSNGSDSDAMELDSGTALPPRGSVRTIGQFSTNVTALCIATINSATVAIGAGYHGDSLEISFLPLDGVIRRVVEIAWTYSNNARLEGIVSITVSSEESEQLLLLCGTRNGVLITIELHKDTLKLASIKYHNIGGTSVLLSADEHNPDLFFANCDSKVYAVIPEMSTSTTGSNRRWLRQVQIHQVWLCNNARSEYQPPNITSSVRLRPSLSGGTGGSMLFVTGSELLIARMSLQPKAVPRHLTIGCTPTRLISTLR